MTKQEELQRAQSGLILLIMEILLFILRQNLPGSDRRAFRQVQQATQP
jgi:hypothetical protein